MKWYKASNNITTDPALSLIAAKTKTYRHEVIAVWVCLLERASREQNGGHLGNIDFEEIDFALELLPGKSKKIIAALEEKEKITNRCLANWGKHQPDTSTARTRKYRERQKHPVTSQNGHKRHCDDVTIEERRVEENREVEDKANKLSLSSFSTSALNDDQKAYFLAKAPDIDLDDLIDTMRNWHTSKGKQCKDAYATLQNWAKREQARINLNAKRGNYENHRGTHQQLNGGLQSPQGMGSGKSAITQATERVEKRLLERFANNQAAHAGRVAGEPEAGAENATILLDDVKSIRQET